LDIEYLKIKIIEIFKIYISDNAIQRKKNRENPGKLSNHSEKNTSKDLEKGFQNLNKFDADISTKVAAKKFKKSKRLKI
jgi:hypothetical protein